MGAEISTATESTCDCYGRSFPGGQLNPAAVEPQMAVCADCLHHLERESLDRSRGAVSTVIRRLGDSVRGVIMRLWLHETKLLGALLRWMDRYSPW